MRYSIMVRTWPVSGGASALGTLNSRDGVRSSSMLRSRSNSCVAPMATIAVDAAISMLVGTLVTVAIWPQTAAPSALAPMIAIWKIDMPRARTQSGKASCADTLRVLAVVIHAAPARNMAGAAT